MRAGHLPLSSELSSQLRGSGASDTPDTVSRRTVVPNSLQFCSFVRSCAEVRGGRCTTLQRPKRPDEEMHDRSEIALRSADSHVGGQTASALATELVSNGQHTSFGKWTSSTTLQRYESPGSCLVSAHASTAEGARDLHRKRAGPAEAQLVHSDVHKHVLGQVCISSVLFISLVLTELDV